jgi:4-amino-4-deoxy-L-arabinose transferase-like glycosyltransferase
MLSKGPIGLMLPVIAFGSDFIYKRNWKAFFKWQYLLVLVIAGVILAPMTYGLYMQFDMHPEIDSYFIKSPSGVRFFYWTQSFGRIFGDNPLPSNFPDPFFLYHSLLWSLLPWPLIFIIAMVYDVKTKIKAFKTDYLNVEVMSTAGFIITIVMLSMSSYQLPHYTFIIHPFAALIISNFLVNVLGNLKWKKVFIYLSVLVWVICVSLSYYIMFVAFETSVLIKVITYVLFVAGIISLFKLKSELETRIIVCGVFIICAANFMVNTAFYKPCFKFQSDSEIAKAMNAMNVKQFSVYNTEITNSGYFYFHGKIDELYSYKEINLDSPNTSGWVMTDSIGKLQIDSVYAIKESKLFYDFPVSGLTAEFINPKTRLAQCKKNYIIKLEKK